MEIKFAGLDSIITCYCWGNLLVCLGVAFVAAFVVFAWGIGNNELKLAWISMALAIPAGLVIFALIPAIYNLGILLALACLLVGACAGCVLVGYACYVAWLVLKFVFVADDDLVVWFKNLFK